MHVQGLRVWAFGFEVWDLGCSGLKLPLKRWRGVLCIVSVQSVGWEYRGIGFDRETALEVADGNVVVPEAGLEDAPRLQDGSIDRIHFRNMAGESLENLAGDLPARRQRCWDSLHCTPRRDAWRYKTQMQGQEAGKT